MTALNCTLNCTGNAPDDLACRQAAMAKIAPLFEGAGHAFVDPPVLSDADLFLARAGEAMRQRLYVTQGSNGAALCMRPDMTLPTAQMAISGAAGADYVPAADKVVRLAYGGLTFRSPQDDTSPEQGFETGIEIFGSADKAAEEAEVLALTIKAVTQASGVVPAVNTGDLALMRAFLTSLDMPVRWRDRLIALSGKPAAFRQLLQSLSTDGRATAGASAGQGFLKALAGLSDPADRKAAVADVLALAKVEAVGGRSVEDVAARLLEQAEDAGENPLDAKTVTLIEAYLNLDCPLADAPKAITALAANVDVSLLENRLTAFAKAGLDAADMRFGGGFGRRFDYYTGFVFELSLAGAPKPVAAGGRYDDVLQELGAGASIPAIGATIRPDRFASLGEAS
ncbi:MAG: ATP phosphoribosyltransferase regulatory subunit [Alphaproteobacteria bacterium]